MTNFGRDILVSGDVSCDVSEMKYTTITSISSTVWNSSGEHNSSHKQSERNAGFSGIGGNSYNSGIYGRQEELSQMKKCFMDVASGGDARLLLVAGVSGSGKSALVAHMRDFVTSSECHGFFCEGKFEQSILSRSTTEPFSALATAFSDVIDFILNQGAEVVQERAQTVLNALGPEISTLLDSVPNLSLLLGSATAQSADMQSFNFAASIEAGASTKTSTQLSNLFTNFLRSLTSEAAPILLFLDDLQFADEDSLDVFRALVADLSLKHVLIVGSYRSNETSLEELLYPNGDSSKSKSSTISTTTIQIGDLDLSAINDGLAETLCQSQSTTEPLSKIVLQKSGGNPFHVVQYLTVLQEKQLLVQEEDKGRWSWDVDQILTMTNLSNNVLELVTQRLQALPDDTRALLTLVAFVGYRFDVEIVKMIVRQLAGTSSSNGYTLENQWVIGKACSWICKGEVDVTDNFVAIDEILDRAIHDGLIEKCSNIVFKFTNDRIQQVLYEMVETESARSKMHYHIGRSVSLVENEKGNHILHHRSAESGYLTYHSGS